MPSKEILKPAQRHEAFLRSPYFAPELARIPFKWRNRVITAAMAKMAWSSWYRVYESIATSFVREFAERIALKPTSANLKRAENHRAAILHAIATNSFDYAATFPQSSNAVKFADQVGDVQTVEAFLDKWLDRQKKHLKASTYNGYRKIVVGQLIPWFGTIMLSALRKKDVRAKLEPMNATNKTMANIQSVLRKALDDAIEDELIEVNPLARWCYSKVEAPQSKDDIRRGTPTPA